MGTTAKTNNSESESTAIFLIKDFISSCLSEYSALGRCIAVRVAIMPAFVNLERAVLRQLGGRHVGTSLPSGSQFSKVCLVLCFSSRHLPLSALLALLLL